MKRILLSVIVVFFNQFIVAQIHMDMQLGGMLANYRNFNVLSSEIAIYPQLKETHWLRPQFMFPLVSTSIERETASVSNYFGIGVGAQIVKWKKIHIGFGYNRNISFGHRILPFQNSNAKNSPSLFHQFVIEIKYLFSEKIHVGARGVYLNAPISNSNVYSFGAVGGGVAFGFRLF
jgi:hypothetical protein